VKRILVVIDYSESFGGGFTYVLNMIDILLDHSFAKHGISFIFAPTSVETDSILVERNVSTLIDDLLVYRSGGLKYKIQRNLMKIFSKFREKSFIDRIAEKYAVDAVYFLTPSDIGKKCVLTPFIFTVWDFCHRDWRGKFPEIDPYVSEKRDILFNDVLKRALNVVVDSDDLAQKAVDYYGVDIKKIVKIPFLMPDLSNMPVNEKVVEKYSLKKPFIFYPAQFWEHKNHKYIIESVSILKHKHNRIINVVFCGRDFGSLKSVQELAKERQVADLVEYLGFIPKEDVWGLYKNALALVMPTYFGPTNIPPIEALSAGCPVIYSDFPSFREEFNGMVEFIDLKTPESLVKKIELLLPVNLNKIAMLKKKHGRELLLEKLNLMIEGRIDEIF